MAIVIKRAARITCDMLTDMTAIDRANKIGCARCGYASATFSIMADHYNVTREDVDMYWDKVLDWWYDAGCPDNNGPLSQWLCPRVLP